MDFFDGIAGVLISDEICDFEARLVGELAIVSFEDAERVFMPMKVVENLDEGVVAEPVLVVGGL